MTDSIAVFPPGERILDSSGAVVSGGTLYFYDAGTTSPRTVYSNSTLTTALGVSVVTDSGGYPSTAGNRVLIYTGTTAYKIVCKDAASVELWSHDNIKGAVDTSAFITSTSSTVTYIVTPVTTAGVWVAADVAGKVFELNASGGDFTRTLPLASTTTGVPFDLVCTGTSGIATLLTQGTDKIQIDGIDTARKALLFQSKADSVRLISNGVDYRAFFLSKSRKQLSFVIEDQRTAPPGSPVAGAYYGINGAPTGAFSTAGAAASDVVMYDGQGNYQIFRPSLSCGWTMYDRALQQWFVFRGASWVLSIDQPAAQADMESPSSVALAVTPGVVKYHPGVAKAWVLFNGTGTVAIGASHNVSSITDNGVGLYTVNLTSAMSSTSYVAVATAAYSATLKTLAAVANVNVLGASSLEVFVSDNNADTLIDCAVIMVVVYGDT